MHRAKRIAVKRTLCAIELQIKSLFFLARNISTQLTENAEKKMK